MFIVSVLREHRISNAVDLHESWLLLKRYTTVGWVLHCRLPCGSRWTHGEDCALSCGFFYAPAAHPLLAKFMAYTKAADPSHTVVNNTILTDCINNNVSSFLLNGRKFVSEEDRLTIFPKEYFCQPSFIPGKSYLLDQFAGSWKDGSKGFDTNRGEATFYRTLRRKANLFLSLLRNEYRSTYFQALLGRKKLKAETWRRKED